MTKRAVIITTSVLVAIMMAITILFGVVFRVRQITFVYDDDFVYKNQVQDILTSSQLTKNISIFELERDRIEQNIEANYPYVKARVNLSSLTSVKITLSNRTPLYYFVQDNIYYILDEDCKVLNVSTDLDDTSSCILLNNVFNATESTTAGQFLTNKYSNICTDLYKQIYSNAVLNIGEDIDEDGELDEKYLDRQDMVEIIKNIQFAKVVDLSGKLDKLVMTTSYGINITVIDPQVNLGHKINSVFSALRTIIKNDKLNETDFATKGSINVVYTYDANQKQTTICEYRV